MSIAPGQQVGNYQVLSRLGVGGMGAVYLAEHPIIGKKVALKVIHKELANNREVISRFYQEARAVNLIGNEHIVEIHDFGQSPEGDHFFIMEYLDGKTLAQVLTRERIFDVGRALHVAAQIADALAATHAAGIIHRDLKPDNIMLCARGADLDFVKLLDFGLAKMVAEGSAQKLTAAGVILGTPQYMSPEACESKKVDHRTDIYALGVLLFQMLTGQVPFDGDSMGAILIKQVIEAPPAPRGLSPMIPPAVEQIILRCLAKSPDARFPTMAHLRDVLLDPDRYLASSPPMMPAAVPSAAAQQATMYAVGTNQALGMQATAALPAARSIMAQDDLFGGPTHQVNQNKTLIADLGPPPRAATAPPLAPGGLQATQPVPAYAASQPMPPYASSQPMPAYPHAGASGEMPRYPTAPPMLPNVPQNQTMVIATPVGYSSKPPPAKKGPWLIVGVAIALVAGVVLVIVLSGGGGASGEAAGSASGSAAASGARDPGAAAVDGGAGAGSAAVVAQAIDAGTAALAIDAASAAAAATAKVTLTSDPRGATVIDPDGKTLGTTPVTVELPADGVERSFVFKKSGYKERTKAIAITEAMTVSVLLEPEARGSGARPGSGAKPGSGGRNHPRGSGSGTGTGSDNVDIMEPDLGR